MSDFTERQWAQAGQKTKARSRAVRDAIEGAIRSDQIKGLGSVQFASPQARELARAEGLVWPHFDGVASSSANGYTTADVRRIIAKG